MPLTRVHHIMDVAADMRLCLKSIDNKVSVIRLDLGDSFCEVPLSPPKLKKFAEKALAVARELEAKQEV